MLAALPITVIVTVPGAAALPAVIVSVEVVTPGASDGALKRAVTPVGIPVGCSDTGPLKPPVRVTVAVTVPLLPRATVSALRDSVIVYPGVVVPGSVPPSPPHARIDTAPARIHVCRLNRANDCLVSWEVMVVGCVCDAK